jgi:quercetin dioxygenase-like cupin family protein
MMVCEFSLKAGSTLPLHSHPHEQAGYVAAGKIRLTVGTETQELGPGGTYYAPPNVPHGAAVLEDAIVVDTFSPPRQDYLPPQS